jgi:hypothetical protein
MGVGMDHTPMYRTDAAKKPLRELGLRAEAGRGKVGLFAF